MKYLITGGLGFLGSNISAALLKRREELIIFDNMFRQGAERNLAWLKEQGAFVFLCGDIRNREDIERIINKEKPAIIFHLAGQVAMTTSVANPRLDYEINVLGSFNVLESVRLYSPDSSIIYSSTNKVYGDLEWVPYTENETRYIAPGYPDGFAENIPLDFHSPYGVSKGCADQYMLDYNKTFKIKTAVFRHSSMYGGRQFSTYDQGWIGWFCQQALHQKHHSQTKNFTISGNGKQVRDLLYVDDVVELYIKAAGNIKKICGEVFNIGGGMLNSLSILELFALLEKKLDMQLRYVQLPPRESDQKIFVADIKKISKMLQWKPIIKKNAGIEKMLSWINNV